MMLSSGELPATQLGWGKKKILNCFVKVCSHSQAPRITAWQSSTNNQFCNRKKDLWLKRAEEEGAA